jgi:copper transport protein
MYPETAQRSVRHALVGQHLARRVARKAAAVGTNLPSVAAPIAVASTVGALAAMGLSAHLLGAGNILSGLIHVSLPTLLDSSAGRVAAVEVVAFTVAAVLASRARVQNLAVVPLLVVVLAEGRRSHVREIAGGWGQALLVVHLAAAATWVGALSYVLTVAWRWRAKRAATHRVMAEYSPMAIMLVLAVAATGTVSSIVVLPRLSALTSTGYGRLLLVKLGLIVIALSLALAGRSRLRKTSPLLPSPAPEHLPGRAPHAERLVLGAVLAVSALLVSVAVPGSASPDLALPPPPAGPVVRMGSLAGQISIGIAASDGQLEVRTSVPNPTGDESGTAVDITAQVGPTVDAQTLRLRRCGSDCFVGPAQWLSGGNELAIRASSRNWTGGTLAFKVPWPPVTNNHVLAQVLAAMRAVPKVTVHETVTSDTAGPIPIVSTNTLTGQGFLNVEPYAKAGSSPVTVLQRDGESTVIAFAMIEEGYYFRLTIGADSRLIGEVIAAPEHLLIRTFDYPE